MDEYTTLSEMLTLVTAFHSSESDLSAYLSFKSEISLDAVSTLSPPQQAQLKMPKVKKNRRRKEGPVRYTTSLQRREKNRIEILREEAQRLNSQLEQLQLSRLGHLGMVPSVADGDPSEWRIMAMVESEGRERAERINRELRAIMANQLEVYASIRKVLGRNNVLEGINVVFEPQPTIDHPLRQFDFSESILAELPTSLGKLRLEADTVLPALKEDLSITCSS